MFFPDNPMIIIGMLFVSLLPTRGMTISWTGFAKGNMNVAAQMTVFGLIFGSILIVIFFPMLMGWITRKYLVKHFGQAYYANYIKQKVPPFSTLGVLGIVFVAMALKAKTIAAQPALLLDYLIPLILSTVVVKLLFN